MGSEEIMTWALMNDSGWMARDRLYQVFRKRGLSKHEITRWLSEWEGKEFMVGTTIYFVDKSTPNKPRRLIPKDRVESN